MTDDIIFAIPTYNRPERQKTVEYLLAEGAKHVVLFVQNRYEEYEEKYRQVEIIRTKATSIAENRNAILDACQGKKVVMMDDDIRRVDRYDPSVDKWERPAPPFLPFVEHCFEDAEQEGAEIWGLYPIHLRLYVKTRPEKQSLTLLIGTVMGMFAGTRRFDEQFRVDEDFDYCARVLLDGKKSIRWNKWAADAEHRTKGGCFQDWSDEKQYARLLAQKYPQLISFAEDKSSHIRVIPERSMQMILHPSYKEDTLF